MDLLDATPLPCHHYICHHCFHDAIEAMNLAQRARLAGIPTIDSALLRSPWCHICSPQHTCSICTETEQPTPTIVQSVLPHEGAHAQTVHADSLVPLPIAFLCNTQRRTRRCNDCAPPQNSGPPQETTPPLFSDPTNPGSTHSTEPPALNSRSTSPPSNQESECTAQNALASTPPSETSPPPSPPPSPAHEEVEQGQVVFPRTPCRGTRSNNHTCPRNPVPLLEYRGGHGMKSAQCWCGGRPGPPPRSPNQSPLSESRGRGRGTTGGRGRTSRNTSLPPPADAPTRPAKRARGPTAGEEPITPPETTPQPRAGSSASHARQVSQPTPPPTLTTAHDTGDDRHDRTIDTGDTQGPPLPPPGPRRDTNHTSSDGANRGARAATIAARSRRSSTATQSLEDTIRERMAAGTIQRHPDAEPPTQSVFTENALLDALLTHPELITKDLFWAHGKWMIGPPQISENGWQQRDRTMAPPEISDLLPPTPPELTGSIQQLIPRQTAALRTYRARLEIDHNDAAKLDIWHTPGRGWTRGPNGQPLPAQPYNPPNGGTYFGPLFMPNHMSAYDNAAQDSNLTVHPTGHGTTAASQSDHTEPHDSADLSGADSTTSSDDSDDDADDSEDSNASSPSHTRTPLPATPAARARAPPTGTQAGGDRQILSQETRDPHAEFQCILTDCPDGNQCFDTRAELARHLRKAAHAPLNTIPREALRRAKIYRCKHLVVDATDVDVGCGARRPF